ncbi:MAG TPA: type IV toxin-antitoxin system AbiEi family antitoxin domain-containing protein [Acidimicrobiales bacterium]|nr:type IV toxin-antitoxin system AbiEi family antitoxin domain-containing protein [Acidimicrobiales bacterium]
MRELPEGIVVAARGRHGVVTAEELAAHGLTRSRVYRAAGAGLLVRLGPQAYAIPGLLGPFSPAAALESHYPEVLCERRTAAALWGLDGFTPRGHADAVPLDLVRDGQRRCQRVPGRQRALAPGEVREVQGLRVTSVERTLFDLSTMAGVDADVLELALESALRAGHTTDAGLRALVDARGRPAARLRAVLARRQPGAPPTGSYAETRFLQTVARPLELEDPERQVSVSISGRPESYRVDFLFHRPRGRLAVEIDGAAWHGPNAPRDDHMRDHHLRMAGVQALHIEADRLERKPATARAAVRRELALLSSPEP